MKCTSCGTFLEAAKTSVRFPCPECGEMIGRCGNCRNLGIKYKCKCGVEGP